MFTNFFFFNFKNANIHSNSLNKFTKFLSILTVKNIYLNLSINFYKLFNETQFEKKKKIFSWNEFNSFKKFIRNNFGSEN